MVHYPDNPMYSDKYTDDYYEYRHVILTRAMAVEAKIIMNRHPDGLMSEVEWRSIGVQQSRGWVHYMQHKPELHVLLFRRPLGTNPVTGQCPVGWKPPNCNQLAV
jgi:cyclin-dependent kinase regulatory subunit CKS1